MKFELTDTRKKISDIEIINDLRIVANNLEKNSLKMELNIIIKLQRNVLAVGKMYQKRQVLKQKKVFMESSMAKRQ